MGNSSGGRCCPKQAESSAESRGGGEEKKEPVYTSLYDYPCRTLSDLSLRRGDILEVIGETQHWFYVRKTRASARGGGGGEEGEGEDATYENAKDEEGYVPREFLKPLNSLEAQPWFFESLTTRLDAKRCLLRPENTEGAFMVWRRRDNRHYYLSVKSGSVVRHYRILEGEDRTFYLVLRKRFRSLKELVESYSADPDGLCSRLDRPCVRLDKPTVATLSYEEQWEVDRTTLKRVERLGCGEFGEVWSGLWNNTTRVAIKEFKVLSDNILREIQIMKELNHERLLRLYGVVTMGEPVCIITELLTNGSLSIFLRAHKQRGDLPFCLMMDFGIQVSEGMSYLETKRIVHRDLRADNILLTEMQSCKIADFGLAQFTFSGAQTTPKEWKVPIKWMAPEIFNAQPYTSKSDVWSFGILLMEIVTYGEDPYPGKNNLWCVNALRTGFVMSCPASPCCPPELYDIMLLCWNLLPLERPAFSELSDRLAALVPESSSILED